MIFTGSSGENVIPGASVKVVGSTAALDGVIPTESIKPVIGPIAYKDITAAGSNNRNKAANAKGSIVERDILYVEQVIVVRLLDRVGSSHAAIKGIQRKDPLAAESFECDSVDTQAQRCPLLRMQRHGHRHQR